MRKCLKMQNAHERIKEVCERKSGQEGFLPKENEFNLEQNEIERQLGKKKEDELPSFELS